MKKITFLLVAFFLNAHLQAQTTTEAYTLEVDKKLQNISKIPITSNILLDRVLSISSITDFNQGARKDTSSYAHFKQVWYELNRASYVKNFSTIATFKEQLRGKQYTKNTIPIGIINTEFHYGNSGESNNRNICFNEQNQTFYNIAGKNPFAKKQTTIIAPLTEEVWGKPCSIYNRRPL